MPSDMPRALIAGESLIDLVESRVDEKTVYLPKVGGAPLNVAVGVARLEVASTLLTAVADDALAQEIDRFLDGEGVVIAPLRRPASIPTPIAVVSGGGSGHSYAFYGSPFSGFDLPGATLPRSLTAPYDLVHLGSSLLLHEGAFELLKEICTLGRLRTLDPNYRPTLVDDLAVYRERVDELLARVDIVKLSEDDCLGAYGFSPHSFATHAHGLGTPTVIVTRAGAPVLVSHHGESALIPVPPTRVVDPTGAGDSFMSALIARLLTDGEAGGLAELAEAVRFAVRASSLTCESPGAAESMPTLRQLEAALR